jgi:hypothetical protein
MAVDCIVKAIASDFVEHVCRIGHERYEQKKQQEALGQSELFEPWPAHTKVWHCDNVPFGIATPQSLEHKTRRPWLRCRLPIERGITISICLFLYRNKMPVPPPNALPMRIVEADGSHTIVSADVWRRICSELKGMRLCQSFSPIGHRLVKREQVLNSDEKVECATKHD